MNIIGDYTELSTQAYLQAVKIQTVQDARNWLLECNYFRTLPDKLLSFDKEKSKFDKEKSKEEMETILIKGLSEIHANQKEDSIRKIVQSWFKEKPGIDTRTISRNYAFDICFILRLSGEKSEELVRLLTGEGIHYRNIEESTKAYCLYHKKSYRECCALLEQVNNELKTADKDQGNDIIPYTYIIRDSLQKEMDAEAFLKYVLSNVQSFDEVQRLSNKWFNDMLDIMKKSDQDIRQKGMLDNVPEMPTETVREIVANNLYRNFLPKSKERQNKLLNCICADWPEETQFSKMSNNEVPVTRKALILLFLASAGGISYQSEYNMDDEEEKPDDIFASMLVNMNAMLVQCGFSKIDPRQPFDWIVLYCMATGDLFDIDERFTGILQQLGNSVQE